MTIEDIRNAVKTVAISYPISRTVLFGSWANGSANADSDVDLIMEFSAPVTLITLSQIKQELEELLATEVDIVHGPIRESDMIEIDTSVEVYAKAE